MTFLQPLLLFGLPLIALPVIIHLINQRRYQTIRWAAMMFLLAANRMSRGYAKLRQFLILLFRMLAIAGLIFAVSRPLAGGWIGRAGGGRPDTTIVLLDRSPSMQQQSRGSVVSKLNSGRHQLARTLETLGSGRWVLIENTTNTPRPLESPQDLVNLVEAGPAGTSADLPVMLEAARDYIWQNQPGRVDIWICSDLRQHDWNPESVRWQALRDSFLELPQGIRIHLLAYPDVAGDNVAVRVTGVRRQSTPEAAELLVSLRLSREAGGESRLSVPIQFEIEGARSELTVEMIGPTFELKDHRIPIDRSRERGWGKVSIPADANPADNEFYFAFDQPQPRRTIVISDDADTMAAVLLAASTQPDAAISCSADLIAPDKWSTIDWDNVALVVWHAPLPEGDAAAATLAFVNRGGQLLFLPPTTPSDAAFQGTRWRKWVDAPEAVPIETWRGDQDILANTQSGSALPVGQLQVRRYCAVDGEMTPLASLKGGSLLLGRVPSNRGGIYFCTTTTAAGDSTLAVNGVVLYVALHRLLAAGAAVLGQTRQLDAGATVIDPNVPWRRVAGGAESISTEYPHQAGVYWVGEKLFAINRTEAEDHVAVVADDRVAELFRGLDFNRVDDRAGSLAGLIQEIWRPFLIVMLVAMLVEAGLCMPGKKRAVDGANAAVQRGDGRANPWEVGARA